MIDLQLTVKGVQHYDIIERHWESFAAVEAAYGRMDADPEIEAPQEQVTPYMESFERQFLVKLE